MSAHRQIDIISWRPCTGALGQRNLAGNIIKPDSLAVCLAPGLRLTSDELLQEFIRTCAETAEQSSAALLSPLHMTQVRHEQRPISCPELG